MLEALGEAARDLGIGALVLIDELQEATAAELHAVNTAVHALGQGAVPLPVMVIAAGLPSLPTLLAEATSYAERMYDLRALGVLNAEDSSLALHGPTTQIGVAWSPEALEIALAAAGGYPYFLQAAGKHVWDVSVRSPISVDDARLGVSAARAEIDDGLYRSRWERATPAQRDLLRMIAHTSGSEPAPVARIAFELGKITSGISVAREELLRKGLVYVPERGYLQFSVPGMDAFVTRQD